MPLSHPRLLASLSLLTIAATFASPAHARDRARSAQGPRGDVQQHVSRQPGAGTRTTTWTNAAGQSGSHTEQRTWDRASQTATASTSTTRINGQTANRSATVEKTGEGSGQIQTSYEGFRGNSGSYAASTTRTENGRTSSAARTGANGLTATAHSTTERTENGYTRSTSATGPGGKSAATQVAVTAYDDGSQAREVTRTAADGTVTTKTHTSQTSTTPPTP